MELNDKQISNIVNKDLYKERFLLIYLIPMELVKITRNRQVTIPKKLFDQLELDEGDYLEVTRDGNEIVFQPQNISPREREQAEEELFDLVDRIRERNEDVDPELVEEEVQKAIQNLRDEQSSYGDDEE